MDHDQNTCDQLLEHLADAIDSELPEALEAHLDSCDACRDLVHDAMATAERVRDAGEGYVAPIDLEQRVLAAIDGRSRRSGRSQDAPKVMLVADKHDDAAPARDAGTASRVALFGRRVWRQRRSVGAGLALAAAVTIGAVALRPKHPGGQPEKTASAPWKGRVATIVGSPDEGLMMIDAQGASHALHQGDKVAAGAHVRTDVRTRARIELDDGSAMVLDRGADVFLDDKENRAVKLVAGSMVVEVKATDGADAKVSFPGGNLTSAAAKVSFASQDAASKGVTSVAVAKGVVSTTDDAGKTNALASGEGGTIGGGNTNVGTAGGLASAFGWSELGETDLGDQAEVPGIGELRARLPGAKNDGDKPLKLTKQSVKVRIAGEIARTEIEETFSNDDPAILEGIFKFPLPPDAQIERLALDVDGKLEEGSFVDKEKGQKIWKGVTYNAQPTPVKPAPREEYIWVPGPWHDPALLEWSAGGRMELKIYPIPAKGSRRVIVAYTQRIAPTAGVRRYVYPLPHFTDAKVAVDDFSIDMQVMGQDTARGVKVKGYEIETTKSATGDAVKATFARKGFVPAGDVVIEYARQEEGATATTYAYQAASGGDSYVALALAPVLPRLPDGAARTQVIVVDTSRSMVGERFTRATAVAARLIDELDPRDRYAVLACDVTCTPLAVTSKTPGKGSGDEVKKFLSAITPDGASDIVSMVSAATMFAKTSGDTGAKTDRKLRVVYIGDGTASIGARTPGALESGVKLALSTGADADASVTAVSVGVDVDARGLDAIARGGGGVVVPYVAGEKLGNVALDILEATYGTSLRDAELTLPEGLAEIAPARLGSLRAGDEAMVVARMSKKEVTGTATLKGTVGGKPWSTSFPIAVRSTTDDGNAFVPRVFAATTIGDLEGHAVDEGEKQKIIELSKSFAVPSRFTSLIVLESETMSKAFGVDKQGSVATWTGEQLAVGTQTGISTKDKHAEGLGTADPDRLRASASSYDDLDGPGGAGEGGLAMNGAGTGGGGYAAPAVAATVAPPAKVPAPVSADATEKKASGKAAPRPDNFGDWGPPGGGWQKMHRVWFRSASFANDAMPPLDLETKIGAAKSAVVGAPDSRDKLADLFGLLARRSDLTEADQVMAKWITRDPLDPKGLLIRADLAAREGDRAKALRIETGALDVRPDDVDLADSLATVALRGGDAHLACSLRAVRAELRSKDVDGLARRVACLRQTGDETAATSLLAALDPTLASSVSARVVTVASEVPPPAVGDLTVDAVWSSGAPADVDLAIVDAKGKRWSWMTTSAIRVADATSTTHETIALPFANGGSYAIEVTRPQTGSDAVPVSGTITARILGQSRSFPFTLAGARISVGRLDVTWASRLEPSFE